MELLAKCPSNIRLEELLRHSPFLNMVEHSGKVARKIASQLEFRLYDKDEDLITQSDMGGEALLILSGSAAIIVNGNRVATRGIGDTIGEMGAISPIQPRSATVRACSGLLVGVISATTLVKVADVHKGIWKNFAVILSKRLLQTGDMHREPNSVPHIFIGSSSESLTIAKTLETELKKCLDFDFEIRCWNNDIFELSRTTIETLERESAECDFAILVAGPDDLIEYRNEAHLVPRDNVIFEAGLFMGALSRSRTFILKPSSSAENQAKLPSDLQGVTLTGYTESDDGYDLSSAVAKISKIIKMKGVKTRFRDHSD